MHLFAFRNVVAVGSRATLSGHARKKFDGFNVIRRILIMFGDLFVDYNSFNTPFFFKS